MLYEFQGRAYRDGILGEFSIDELEKIKKLVFPSFRRTPDRVRGRRRNPVLFRSYKFPRLQRIDFLSTPIPHNFFIEIGGEYDTGNKRVLFLLP